ncbi:IS1634 family transposase, partial [Candidatus Micrarchaeota archaeon]|nr:IS1634 family transposase [Candidatus Micrarchaeota archaeon]
RRYLTIVQGYRDPVTKKVRHKTVKSLGYLDELEKQYPDPITHFRGVVEEMNQKAAFEKQPVAISLDPEKILTESQANRKNIGYAALSKLYHELSLNTFFYNKSRSFKSEFNTNNIMKLLIFSRILAPASKKKTYEEKDRYFENTDFSLDDVYRCLTQAVAFKDGLQMHLHRQMKNKFGRNTELVYYDVTNYYFETDRQDEMKKKGMSKEHRPDPIVQMGLLMDTKGIPVLYDIFPGNTNDCATLMPVLDKVKKAYEVGRTIVVADKGINTADNIAFSLAKGDGYVYSQTVRGGNKELKDYVLDGSGYRQIGDDYKIKSRLYPREIAVSNAKGGRSKVRIDEKQVVFYSAEYDRKAKADRLPALMKARDLVNNPSRYNKSISYGAAKYVKNLIFDQKTGEIMTAKQKPIFDERKLLEEEKFDGYYAIVTSEWKKSDEEILEIYRGLWRIEEAFKVTKSDLKARPVYLSRNDHIQAHFLICFVALFIARLLALRLDNKYTISRIVESLNKSSGSLLEENWYVFDYADEITKTITEVLGVDLNRKYLKLGDIKKILGATKKT